MSRKLARRTALLGLGGAVTLGRAALALGEAATDRRLVVVLLRGGLDGLAAVVPTGDAHLHDLRPELLSPGPGQGGGVLDLDGFWGLHPALSGLHGLYAAGELLAVHAVAGGWRSRSHFEAQDYLEAGACRLLTSGWLNRVASRLPRPAATEAAIAIGATPPPLLRGPTPVGSWLPHGFASPGPALYEAVAALNRDDPVTGPAFAEGLRERAFTASVLPPAGAGGNRSGFAALAEAAGYLLAAADGPRLAAMELDGWDTHAAQLRRLDAPLRQLDAGMLALKTSLGAAWTDTAVLVVTEFGRTVRANGTAGTDHGTGGVAFVLGGRVAGGRVLADWPGLAPGRLFENRDLQPTRDVLALANGVVREHLGLVAEVFPGTAEAEAGVLRK